MALHYHSQMGSNSFHELMIVSAAFGGYIVILVGILTGIFTGQPVNKRIVSMLHTYLCTLTWVYITSHKQKYAGLCVVRAVTRMASSVIIIMRWRSGDNVQQTARVRAGLSSSRCALVAGFSLVVLNP